VDVYSSRIVSKALFVSSNLCTSFCPYVTNSLLWTWEVLKEIEAHNPKVKIVHSEFYEQDAAIFAKLANDLVAQCRYETVLYYQSDEIWHENLINLTQQALAAGKRDLSFWRVQLKYNFQLIKWFPHPVHRIGLKEKFNFTGDGMTTDSTFDATMVSNWGMEHFIQWGDKYKNNPVGLPLDEMILDVSLTGGFLHNIPDRRRMHLPFWGEGDVMPADEDGLSVDEWHMKQKGNLYWDLYQTPFNIPQIMQWHIGRKKYELRPDLLEALKAGEGWR